MSEETPAGGESFFFFDQINCASQFSKRIFFRVLNFVCLTLQWKIGSDFFEDDGRRHKNGEKEKHKGKTDVVVEPANEKEKKNTHKGKTKKEIPYQEEKKTSKKIRSDSCTRTNTGTQRLSSKEFFFAVYDLVQSGIFPHIIKKHSVISALIFVSLVSHFVVLDVEY